MKVVVTGATGFVGTALIPKLLADGHAVTALVRNAERARERLRNTTIVEADIETPGAWCNTLDGAGAIIHLAGESIGGKRWDARQKQLIRDSRVESTRTIVEAIGKTQAKPQALITASGVDYYPYASRDLEFDDDEVTEADAPAETFLGRLCRDWEKEARAAEAFGVRVACMRCGLILGKSGDLVARWRKPFDMFVGGRLGSGMQWVSWVHLDDVVRAYAAAVTDPRYRGPINLVTDSTRNADFSRALGKALHKPSWLPAPAFAIKAAVGGEFAESILEGRRAVPAKLRELGFHWQHPALDDALAASV
jgi:uncharacterized protein (TIGR01777 family)